MSFARGSLLRGRRPSLVQGAGKPSTVYELPPEAEMVFSRAYPPVLGALLEEVVSRLPSEQMEAILVGTGRRLAQPLLPPGTASRAARLRAAVVCSTRWVVRRRWRKGRMGPSSEAADVRSPRPWRDAPRSAGRS
jgi:hypothetical protein